MPAVALPVLALPILALLAGPAGSSETAANGETVVPGETAAACERMFDWVAAADIRFHQSQAALRESSLAALMRIAEFARDCPEYRIRITGHTDDVGGESYNQALSKSRAEAVAQRLADLGVPRSRLVVAGAGASEPVADNATAFGRERNRRIELELLPATAAGTQDPAASSGDAADDSSTSKTSVELGGIGPRPAAP